MIPQTTPVRLDLKKDEKLEVEWQDGHVCVYPLAYLRGKCPCALCRRNREQPQGKNALPVLTGSFDRPPTVVEAELVGNYALRIEWSDNHGSGIYSFQYLRSICREKEPSSLGENA